MTNHIFSLCVDFLVWTANLLGTSYETVNVWIFCVTWPLFTLLLVAAVVRQHIIIRRLKNKLEGRK